MAAAHVTGLYGRQPSRKAGRPQPHRKGWPVCDASGIRPANARICRWADA